MSDPLKTLSGRLIAGTLPHGLMLCGGLLKDHAAFITSLVETQNVSLKDLSHVDVLRVRSMKSEIVISQIHEMIRWLSIAPHELRVKFAWIEDGENLNASSSNALLKTLEEPPPHGYIVISVPSPDKLLSTIRSRLVTVRVPSQPAPLEGGLPPAPEWVPDLESFLKQPSASVEAIFSMSERISKERDDLPWFLNVVQKTLTQHLKASALSALDLSFDRHESLYRQCLGIEWNAYQRYGNIALYLDRFFMNWFSRRSVAG